MTRISKRICTIVHLIVKLLSLDISYHMGQVGECKNKLSHLITYTFDNFIYVMV